jgi:hypothetical protein
MDGRPAVVSLRMPYGELFMFPNFCHGLAILTGNVRDYMNECIGCNVVGLLKGVSTGLEYLHCKYDTSHIVDRSCRGGLIPNVLISQTLLSWYTEN